MTKPVFVEVLAEEVAGTVKFSHDWRFDDGPSQGGGPIVIPKGTPRSPIQFKLNDQTGRQFRFFASAEVAIWAKVDHCPDTAGGGGQIDYNGSVSGGPNLRVHNLNSEKCVLHYALRFEDKDGKVEVYDPEIINGGKG